LRREIKINVVDKIIGVTILIIGGALLFFTLQTEGLHPTGYVIILIISFLLLFLGSLTLALRTE